MGRLSSSRSYPLFADYHDVCLEYYWGCIRQTIYRSLRLCDLRRLTEAQIKVFVTTVAVQSTIKAESFWPVQFQTISVLQLRGRVKIVLSVQCLFPCSLSVYTGCTICELLSLAYWALSSYGSSEVFSKTLSQHLEIGRAHV